MTSNTPAPPHHHAHRGHGPAPENDLDLAELLDLDAVHAAPFVQSALDAAALALARKPRVIVDLGAGTGTGTVALATRFPEARVLALDASARMLERVRASTSPSQLAARVETHLVDLDDDWTAVVSGHVDLAWAALSLHHTSSPARVLQQLFALLQPGGVAVVSEFTGATAYRPADLGTGRDGVGQRLVAALEGRGYPVTADWTEALAAAGFDPVDRHDASVDVSSQTVEGARFLELQMARTRHLLADDTDAADIDAADIDADDLAASHLDADDLAAIDAAIDSVSSGGARLDYSSPRVFWVAVKPATATASLTATTAAAPATGVDR